MSIADKAAVANAASAILTGYDYASSDEPPPLVPVTTPAVGRQPPQQNTSIDALTSQPQQLLASSSQPRPQMQPKEKQQQPPLQSSFLTQPARTGRSPLSSSSADSNIIITRVGVPVRKIGVVGDANVGKTTLIHAIIPGIESQKDLRSPTYKPTIGVDMQRVDVRTDNHTVTLEFYDTAGAERHGRMPMSYLRFVDVIVYAYDMTNRDTLKGVEYWRGEIDTITNTENPPLSIMVGLKHDAVKTANALDDIVREAAITAERHGMQLSVVASAWTGVGVHDLARILATRELTHASTRDRQQQHTLPNNRYTRQAARSAQGRGQQERAKQPGRVVVVTNADDDGGGPSVICC